MHQHVESIARAWSPGLALDSVPGRPSFFFLLEELSLLGCLPWQTLFKASRIKGFPEQLDACHVRRLKLRTLMGTESPKSYVSTFGRGLAYGQPPLASAKAEGCRPKGPFGLVPVFKAGFLRVRFLLRFFAEREKTPWASSS